MLTLKEARDVYMKLLKDTEELTLEERALARESFTEGWTQCELHMKDQSDAIPSPPSIR